MTVISDFLVAYYGDESPVLTAIIPDMGGAHSRTFKPGDGASMDTWIRDWQARQANIYFTVNPVKGAINDRMKAKKTDIKSARVLHVDIDPRDDKSVAAEKERGLAALRDYAPYPSIVIDSGNGVQAFWLLEKDYPIDQPTAMEAVENRNRKIALDLDADINCYNIDRIMRVPGTTNYPNASKRKKGRVVCESSLIYADFTMRYSLERFKEILQTDSKPTATVAEIYKIPDSIELSSLPQLSDDLKSVVLHGGDPAKADRWRSRSEMQFWTIIQLRMSQVSRETIASILLDQRYGVSAGILEKRDSKAYALRQIRRAEEKGGISEKPTIEVTAKNLEEQIDKAEGALVNAGVEMFQSFGQLTRIAQSDDNKPPKVLDVRPYWLQEKFLATAQWVKRNVKGQLIPFEPKIAIAHHYIDREGEWRVPHLRGLTLTPTLREDWTLVSEPGYDKMSGLFYEPLNLKFDAINEQPTKADAVAALNMLVEPLAGFPFIPDDKPDDWRPEPDQGLKPAASRSVVISAILTGLVRHILRAAPLHAIDAPEKGTGKSKLCDYISIILTGEPPNMMSFGADEDEERKKMYATLAEGPRIVVFDNVDRPVEGDALCTILTQETWQARILGKSRMSTVSTKALFMATGNNITFRGDMVRRVVIAKLDARTEHPDARQFTFDPRDVARTNRVALVKAGLTILMAYIHAGQPLKGTLKALGSYEDWALIREALVWLEQPDPIITKEQNQSDDPAKLMLVEVMEAWSQCYGDDEIKLSGAIGTLLSQGLDEKYTRLREVLAGTCNGSRLNQRGVNWWLRKNASKIVDERRFVRIEDIKQGTLVKLEGGAKPSAVLF